MVPIFEFSIVLVALVVGTITDIKWREVPDWLNFALIATGFGVGIIKAIIDASMLPIYTVGIGFGLAFIIALVMFYSGQWGGGDAKMLMGIGAVIGASLSFSDFFISFVINTIAIGAIYGLAWGLSLGVIHREAMFKEMRKTLELSLVKKLRLASIITAITLIILIFVFPLEGIRFPLILMVFLLFMTLYLWVYVKAVEAVCFVKNVKPSELTEGDWIIGDIKQGNKIIASKKDLGVSKEQIEKLKKMRLKFVTIKTGIPFVPSFLIAYILTYFAGNLFLLFIR